MTGTTDSVLSEPIEVLLVDDNRDWLQLVKKMLEREAVPFSVRVAHSATDALDVLSDEVECVVSDYYMPGMTGIELLKAVRERRRDLPFLLFTGAGNEGLASKALAAGADDYVIKAYTRDNTTTLAARIRTAVEKFRAEKALADSEARYRTLVENVRDAIFVTRDQQVVLVNESAVTLSGYDRETLTGTDLAETVVHPEDRRAVRTALEDDTPQSLEVRLQRHDSETRHCLLDIDSVANEGQTGVICVFRDVTAQVEHQRQLRRERDTKEAIREMLVNHSSRQKIADAFCRYVGSEDGTVFAWVGERTTSGCLTPLATVGDTDYLDSAGVLDAGSVDSATTEPSLQAFRTGSTVASTVTPDDEWHDAAETYGIDSATALSLRYGGVDYGVLGVYRSGTGDRSDREHQRLEELAETLGYALSTAENREALLADEVARIDLTVNHRDLGLFAVSSRLGHDAELVVHTVLPGDDHDRYFVTCRGTTAGAVAEACDTIEELESHGISATDDGIRAQLDVVSSSLGVAVADAGGIVQQMKFSNGEATVAVDLPRRRPATAFVEALSDQFDDVVVTACTHHTVEDDFEATVLSSLTDRQREALEVAFHSGYFERPKRSSAADVATAMNVSRSTFTQHLRAAQRKVLGELYENKENT
ncbi:helix-turn-helix domain-containing protein (plasmid) [Haloferax sp. S1W]|uniref:helix-turn-helix domain-containing protein n=1 Tax=Haloferax sp. S1W TaxID=3377110 RepID=UPI0037C9F803